MFSNILPQKAGVKRRVIKKFQANKARKWEHRWVLHPGSGETAAGRCEDTSTNAKNRRQKYQPDSQKSDSSMISALEACDFNTMPAKFPRISNDPIWIKKWVSRNNFSSLHSDLCVSATD